MNDVTTGEPGNGDEIHAVTAPEEPAATGGIPSRRPARVVLAVLPYVLVLAAVGGAVAYTVHTVRGADRTVRAEVLRTEKGSPAKDPAGDVSVGRASTELSKLLLPVPKGFALGPDSAGDGNDTEISGKKATAAMKETGRGLSGKQRREFDAAVEKLKVQGVAVRTYRTDAGDLAVESKITKMRDRKAVRDTYVFITELTDSVGVFRKGPEVKGHKHAKCYLMPTAKDFDGKTVNIDGMQCFAYDGDVSVSLVATGSKPFDKSAVIGLLKDQLDHIASPGEYI
ncbi:hypothetical protein [Streptomyces sp. bgisy091]|uniref:hypothetical protein n=1 Tax=Streptomyces sp. bgisy091 TaxID=3413778 RepID=UPI003D75377E